MCGIVGHVSLNAEPLKASPSVVHAMTAAMTHSVENRCPFLYHSFIELCMTLPLKLRVRALNEKYLLKKAFESSLPAAITKRRKRPFTTFYVSSLFPTLPP